MPWMVIYPLGGSFSYIKNDHFKGTAWIVSNLVDIVSKGGNFMPGIGPDGNGRFDPEAVRELEAAGKWLEVNGEAIYGTRRGPASYGSRVTTCASRAARIARQSTPCA